MIIVNSLIGENEKHTDTQQLKFSINKNQYIRNYYSIIRKSIAD
jgi:hypothetical protein